MKKTLSLLYVLFFASQSFATTWVVGTVGSTFVPDSITITEGDTVNFLNLGGSHNAVEVSQATWNVNGNTSNGGFSVPFGGGMLTGLTAGVYYYVCTVHHASGMKGRIFVQPAVVNPSLEFVITSSSYTESAGSFQLAVSITNPNSNPTSVDVNVLGGGTATSGTDYMFGSSLTLTFPGNSPFTQSITINITNDILVEGNESFTLRLANATNNATIGTNAQHVVTILDDDTLKFSFPNPSLTVNENAGLVVIPVHLNSISSNSTEVTVHLESVGTTAVQGTDFYFNDTTLFWPAGSFNTIDVPVTIFDDTTIEADETVRLSLINPTNGALLFNDTFLLTILNNDTLPPVPAIIRFTSTTATVTEDDISIGVIVETNNPGTATTAFIVARDNVASTASSGTDFIFQNWPVNHGPGLNYDTVYIHVKQDALIEPAETVVLHFAGLNNAVVGADSLFVLNILDEDTLTASFHGAGFSYIEADTLVAIRITLSTFPADTTHVSIARAPGNATNNIDFIFSDTTVVFLPNVVDTQVVWVQLKDDTIDEPNEQINFNITQVTAGTNIAIAAYTLTIIDNDSPTGISEVDWSERISTYPNPASGTMFIETRNKVEEVTITGITGNVWFRWENLPAGKNQIDISSLQPGMYFISSTANSFRFSKRFIKQD